MTCVVVCRQSEVAAVCTFVSIAWGLISIFGDQLLLSVVHPWFPAVEIECPLLTSHCEYV